MKRASYVLPYLLMPVVASLCLTGCQRKSAPKMPPQTVKVVTMAKSPTQIHTVLPGRTEAIEIAQVRPQVSGVIMKRLFVEGSEVTVGQHLYQIDPSIYQAQYDAYKASLLHAQAEQATARAKLARYKPLVEAHAVSRQDYDDALAVEREADADIAQAQANIENAATNLRYTHMDSPISGRIGRSISTVGALVTANQTAAVTTVTQLDPIYVDVNLAATDLLRFRRELANGTLQRTEGDAATVTLTLEDGTQFDTPGKLQFSEVNVDTGTSSVVVRAVFPNPQHMLLPGMYVHAEILEGVDPSAFLAPQDAVMRDTAGNPYVMVVGDDKKVSTRPITVGPVIGTNWVVYKGLNDGDKVIVEGLQKAKPGAVVKPVPADDTQAATQKAG